LIWNSAFITIPFNQNQSLFVVGLNWDPFCQPPLTRTKVYLVGLNWDPFVDLF
jgi:hypothetical protein